MAGQPPMTETEKMHWALAGNIGVSWNFSMAYIQQIKASKAEYEAGKITYEQSLKETKTNVQKLFYGLLLQQESLAIQKNSLANARQRAEQAETNYKNGLVPELSLLQAQVTYENMRPDVKKAERELKQQIDTFAFLLGLPVGTEIKLAGSITTEYIDANYEKLIDQYGSSSLDIKSLEKNIEIVELNCKALKLSAYTPALALSWGYQPTGSGFNDFDEFNDKGSLSLTVAWNLTNILPWSSTQQQIKTLNANLEKLQISREMLLENKRIEVRKACNTLQEAREQITNMGRNIELAERSYYSTLKAYRNGTRELLDLRDAENQLNQAKLGLAAQKFNYISALLDLENTLDISLTAKNTENK
jgi:outer membrane protein TolC